MTKWIKSSEKLPQEGIEVWGYDKEEGVCLGYQVRSGEWYVEYEDCCGVDIRKVIQQENVTHWMPFDVPKPPEDK